MSSANQDKEQPAALRRSSRATRGSVKPVIDLTQPELSDHEEDNKTSSRKAKTKNHPESDNEDVQVLDESDEEEYQEERTVKKKRAPKSKKQQADSTKEVDTKKNKTPAAGKTAKKATKSKEQPDVKPSIKSSADQSTTKTNTDDDNLDSINICYELNEKEMKEINNAFDLNSSTDGEELLASDDLKTAIRSLGFEPRADEIQRLVAKFSNKKGKINRDSFHKIMAFKMGSSPSVSDSVLNDDISKVFNLLDLDKTGVITLENLRSISKELNEEITDEELHEMIQEADIDGDFQINKQEFYNIMKKTSLY